MKLNMEQTDPKAVQFNSERYYKTKTLTSGRLMFITSRVRPCILYGSHACRSTRLEIYKQ